MKKASLLFLPVPGIGHLVSAVELAKRLVEHEPSISVTVLAVQSPLETVSASSYIQSVASSIQFVQLPRLDFHFDPNRKGEALLSLFMEKHKPLVSDAIATLLTSSPSIPIRAFIVDLFATTMLDVATQFTIPTYLYFPSSAAMLGFTLYMPTLHLKIQSEFRDLEGPIEIPGMSPVPPLAIPTPLLDKKNEAYTWLLYHASRFRETTGLIVNTFEELEPQPLWALAEGKCLPDHPTPSIYPVGPLLAIDEKTIDRGHDCVKWLDDQPPSSVVFLCFGSYGAFPDHQVKEIAVGLEQSGHRFLWTVRSRSPEKYGPLADAKLEDVLPEGFIERTRERGLVWPAWAPQLAILSHPAVGGFVSHCGWNSCLESVWFGVPIVAWPLYAEQRVNAFEMVKDLGLAVELMVDYKGDGLVCGEELERALSVLMEREGGKRVRDRAKEMREASRRAVKEGGSSSATLARLAKEWLADGTRR